MTVIEASSGTYRSRVDGTIVLQVEISPIHRADALALFGMPGTPLALAALKVGHAAKSDEPAVEEKPKGGPLAKLAGIWCADPLFQAWLTECADLTAPLNEESAADVVRDWCGINSRAELDTNLNAEAKFQQFIRGPYMKHQIAKSA